MERRSFFRNLAALGVIAASPKILQEIQAAEAPIVPKKIIPEVKTPTPIVTRPNKEEAILGEVQIYSLKGEYICNLYSATVSSSFEPIQVGHEYIQGRQSHMMKGTMDNYYAHQLLASDEAVHCKINQVEDMLISFNAYITECTQINSTEFIRCETSFAISGMITIEDTDKKDYWKPKSQNT